MNREQKELRKKYPIQAKLKDAMTIEIGRICKLFREGCDTKEICNKLLLTEDIVEKIIKDLGLRKRYRNYDY